jgi:hypothetical protein
VLRGLTIDGRIRRLATASTSSPCPSFTWRTA